MTEIAATVTPQAAATAKSGAGANARGGAAPFGALGFLNLILANAGGQQGGIGLIAAGQAAAGAQGAAADTLANVQGLQQALQDGTGDAAAALQALQNNSQINLAGLGAGIGTGGGLLAQLLANLADGELPAALGGGNGLTHQLTGQEIAQFDPTQLTIEQLISGELQSITLPNGKEISNEQALLALLLRGRVDLPPPVVPATPDTATNGNGTDVAALAKQIGDAQTPPLTPPAPQTGPQSEAPAQTPPGTPSENSPENSAENSHDDILAALLAATGQPTQNPAPPEETPVTPTLPLQATAGQAAGQAAGQNGNQTPAQAGQAAQNNAGQNSAGQNNASLPQNAPPPDNASDTPARTDYEWRASQSNGSSGTAAQPGGNGRDTAIQSLLSALNGAQPSRSNGAPGPQQALNILQSTPAGLVAAVDGGGDTQGFDLNNGGRGPFGDADGLIEEMLTQHHSQAGRGGEARPSQSFTSLLTTARSATTGHPATQTVAFQMGRMSANGMERITLRLDPPELGRVEVRMEFSDDGKVKAHLIADRPDTLDTLQRDARALERALQDAGLDADGSSLTFDLRQGDDNNGRDPQDGRSRNAYQGPDAIDADNTGDVTTHVNIMPGGLAGHMKLDLLV